MAEKKMEDKEKREPLFSKEQMVSSEHFKDRKDIVNALLSPNMLYSVEDVEQLIAHYMKGEVR